MTPRIQNLVQEFTRQLEAAIREQLAADVHGLVDQALGNRGSAAVRGNGKKASARADGKRTPAQMERVTARLLEFIAKNPGQRSEQIAKATGMSTGDMVTPIKKLIAAKKIKAKGKARGTTYNVAG